MWLCSAHHSPQYQSLTTYSDAGSIFWLWRWSPPVGCVWFCVQKWRLKLPLMLLQNQELHQEPQPRENCCGLEYSCLWWTQDGGVGGGGVFVMILNRQPCRQFLHRGTVSASVLVDSLWRSTRGGETGGVCVSVWGRSGCLNPFMLYHWPYI